MKLTVPPLDISEDEGFSADKDIFQRAAFGERLASLIENANDNLVIALDSQWGEGKSTFIKMWRGYVKHHRENALTTVYFDAFANDYQKDPFLALASEIYEILPNASDSQKNKFIKKAGNAAKAFTRGAIKIGVKAVTGGLLDGSVIDTTEKDISDLISGQIDNVLADRFKSTTKDKLAIKTFKEHLEEVAKNHGNGRPIIFIIDELDRCKPDFALDLIEQIKHLFSVKGITFILVLNKVQLEEYVRCRYGKGVVASLYLQKFINIWLNLPRKIDKNLDHGAQYFAYTINKMLDKGEPIVHSIARRVLEDLIKLHKPSYREIERVLSYYALIQNMSKKQSFDAPFQYIIAFVCYMKCLDSVLLEMIYKNEISPEDILKRTGLNIFNADSNEKNLYKLANHIRYDLSSDTVRTNMIKTGLISEDQFGFGCNDIFTDVSSWLREININL